MRLSTESIDTPSAHSINHDSPELEDDEFQAWLEEEVRNMPQVSDATANAMEADATNEQQRCDSPPAPAPSPLSTSVSVLKPNDGAVSEHMGLDDETRKREQTQDIQPEHRETMASNENMGESGTVVDSQVEEATVSPSPSLAEEIVKAVRTAARNYLIKGDVAIILDCDDLSKTLLVDEGLLNSWSSIRSACEGSDDIKAASGLSRIYIIETTEDVPALGSIALAATFADLDQARSRIYTQPATEPSKAVRIKKEGAEDEMGTPKNCKDSSTGWIAAYTAMMAAIGALGPRAKQPKLFDHNALTARAYVTAVITLTEKYHALPALQRVFGDCVLRWIQTSSLYRAIKEEPSAWLEIGASMQNENVFREAFVHCAGILDSFPNRIGGLRFGLNAVLEKKAAKLKALRQKANRRLASYALLTMAPLDNGYVAPAVVSANHEPFKWLVNQFFTNWMVEHLQYLFDEEDVAEDVALDQAIGDETMEVDAAAEDRANINTTATCDHKEGSMCITVGGFYRVVGEGGTAYLPMKKVMELLQALSNKFAEGKPDVRFRLNEQGVRGALDELKNEATKAVGKLVQWNLQLVDKEKLEYLTCAEVEASDFPWQVDVEMEL